MPVEVIRFAASNYTLGGSLFAFSGNRFAPTDSSSKLYTAVSHCNIIEQPVLHYISNLNLLSPAVAASNMVKQLRPFKLPFVMCSFDTVPLFLNVPIIKHIYMIHVEKKSSNVEARCGNWQRRSFIILLRLNHFPPSCGDQPKESCYILSNPGMLS